MNYQRHMYAVGQVATHTKAMTLTTTSAYIIYVDKGLLEITVDRRFFRLADNTLLVIQARHEMELVTLSGSYTLLDFKNYQLAKMSPNVIYELAPFRFAHEFIVYEGVGTEEIAALNGLRKQQGNIYLFEELLRCIFESYEAYEHSVKHHTFDDIIHYIKEYAHEPLTREEVARRFGYNANYFSERFKKEVGWGFSEFLTHIRLENAKQLLLSTQMTIQEVAKAVGYQDGLYLSRKFSQQIGMAPSKFRKRDLDKRIATLQFTGTLLALGIEPVAVLTSYYNLPNVISPYVRNAIKLSPNWIREHIDWGEQKPELIITSVHEYPPREYIELSNKIAPSIALEWDTHDRLEEVRMLGKIFQREEEGERFITRYEKSIIEARYALNAVRSPEKTVGLYELRNHERIGIWRPNSRGGYNLFSKLKLKVPNRIYDEVIQPDRGIVIDEQDLPNYAADEMFVIVHNKEQEVRFFNELWQSLPAMRRQKVYILQLTDFWSSEGVALEEQLKIQLDYLLHKKISDIYL